MNRINLRPIVAILSLLVLIGCRAHPTTPAARQIPAEPALSESQKQLNLESFDVVWNTVNKKHFDPKFNGVDWNAVKTELRPKVEQAATMSQARGVMSDMLDRLGQTHFAIIPASVYREISPGQADDDGSHGAGVSGITLRIIDGHALVTDIEPGSGTADAGAKRGWELIGARQKPIAPVLEKVGKAYVNSTLKPGMQALTIESTLRGDIGKTVAMTFLDGAGKKITLDIELKAPTGQTVQFGSLPTFYVKYVSRILPPDVGYIAFSAFFGPTLVPDIRKSIEEFMARNTDGLIIDIRGNPGGVGIMAVGIGNLLVSKPDQKLGEMHTRGGTFKFVLNPQSAAYDKPVAVLVDECSMSTSEILAGGLRDIGRARIFGTRTAGAALPSAIVRLPNGDGFQYAFANYLSAGGEMLEGNGVAPDETVVLDRAALLSGRDPVIEAAMKWIESQKK